MSANDKTPRIQVTPQTDVSGKTIPLEDTPKTVVILDGGAGDGGGNGAGGNGAGDAAIGPALSAQCEILEKIGDGGMGVVYLARDRKLDRFVAVKRLHRACLTRPALRERFFREAKAIAAISHVNIVHVYALGEDHHGPYIVMEYVPGPAEMSPDKTPPHPFTLADMVHKDGPLPVGAALDLMLKLCRAVDYAHRCGVIHRDLKPSNVLLTQSREPKIVDFGLARVGSSADEKLTVPGERMLSLGYGAPEQESDASLTDERADVYGLGALLYFSVTGRNPRYFRENDVPEALRLPLVKALETDRDRRWPSAAEFLQALMRVKAPTSIELPTVKTTWRCKWCDTVNPVAVQFCGTCGWDGGDTCLECRAPMRVGIQFCGECGADARDYESARLLRDRLQAQFNAKAFESIVQSAQRISGFKPIGPRGEEIVKDVHRLRDDARKAIDRREKLRLQIPRDLEAGNYEAARGLIDEYNRLSPDGAFKADAARLPGLLLTQTVQRARALVDQGQFTYARGMLQALDTASGEVVLALRHLRSAQRWRVFRWAALSAIAMLLAYAFSAAPVYRLLAYPEEGAFHAFYRAARFLQQDTAFRPALLANARVWGVPQLFGADAAVLHAVATNNGAGKLPTPVTPVDTERLGELKTQYAGDMEKAEAEAIRRNQAWPRDYIKALSELQERIRKGGDFEGWVAVSEEIDRFAQEESLYEDVLASAPAPLRDLENRFLTESRRIVLDRSQQVVGVTRRHLEELGKLQRTYTMQGKMGEAAAVYSEIRRAQSNPRYVEAQVTISESKPPAPAKP